MTRSTVGVAVVGCGWMGVVHSRAYARVAHHYPDLPLLPHLVAVCDPAPERRADAARAYGFGAAHEDWRALVDDPRIAAVSITAPNAVHREIAVAMAGAGKHVWVEKPVGLTAADARAVARAVREAGVASAVGFNYRHAPAVEQARVLIRDGAVGEVTNARFRFFSDYAAHPQGALSWRFERALGGAGVLGDLASHAVDLVRYLLGDLDRLVADTATVIGHRPRPVGDQGHFSRADGGEPGVVENEDYVGALIRTSAGARVVLEASRVAVGEQNSYGFEIHGTKGHLAWDFRRLGELVAATGGDYQDVSARTVLVGPSHGELAAFQPGAGIAMGYDDLKVIEAAAFLRSIAGEQTSVATVADAVHSAVALDAMVESARTGSWVALP